MKGFKTIQIFSFFVSRAHSSAPVNTFKNYLYEKPFHIFLLKDDKKHTFASETPRQMLKLYFEHILATQQFRID